MSILRVIDQNARPTLNMGQARGVKQSNNRGQMIQRSFTPFMQGAPSGAIQAAEEMPIQGSPFNQQRMQVGPRYNSISALLEMANGRGVTEDGAMSPDMVNVSWSDVPVPYEKSLNPPDWYKNRNAGKRTKRFITER